MVISQQKRNKTIVILVMTVFKCSFAPRNCRSTISFESSTIQPKKFIQSSSLDHKKESKQICQKTTILQQSGANLVNKWIGHHHAIS